MKSKLFLEAAKIIDAKFFSSFSCNALGYAAGGARVENADSSEYALYVDCDEITFYTNLFKINGFSTFNSMYKFYFEKFPTADELQETRVLALLLAGEVLKSEKKSFSKSIFGKKFKRRD